MTTIIKKYIGFTHPLSDDKIDEKLHKLILEAWKSSNCPQGIHLWDEVYNSDKEHYLFCDACEIEVHIEKVIIPDGKDDILE